MSGNLSSGFEWRKLGVCRQAGGMVAWGLLDLRKAADGGAVSWSGR